MSLAVLGAQLHHAERVTPETQTHGLRIDRHGRGALEHAGGQVALMKMMGQGDGALRAAGGEALPSAA
jgi:hypothetical protein